MSTKKLDGVFEGGGVKGTGLVGAVEVTLQKGYVFENVAGASAGAIVAALIAAGYTAKEMREIMLGIDYLKFRDEGFEDKIPLVGKPLSLFLEKGIYEGDYFLQWIKKKRCTKAARKQRKTSSRAGISQAIKFSSKRRKKATAVIVSGIKPRKV